MSIPEGHEDESCEEAQENIAKKLPELVNSCAHILEAYKTVKR